MKHRILELLRHQQEVISGESLSAELGVSRVAIWKHIQKLQECGYGIESSSKGYRLTEDIDGVFPWEFPDREDRIHYFQSISSTMEPARELARGGCPHFTVVITDEQVSGRGRLNRTWLSSKGGLYFTVIVRPDLPAGHLSRINFCASLTMAVTLRNLFQLDVRVKWPNDIQISGKKICGILCEIEAEADRISFLNIGIGVNVNNDLSETELTAVSLKQLLGKSVKRKVILSEFLDQFERRLDDPNHLETVVSEWKTFTVTIGKPVKIVTIHDTYEGTAADIDDDGALILQSADGSIKRILHGDCFHQSTE